MTRREIEHLLLQLRNGRRRSYWQHITASNEWKDVGDAPLEIGG